MTVKVSIIVAIENFQDNHLKDCIKSILLQSLNDIEVICVSRKFYKTIEDFSKDDDRIKYINSKESNLKNNVLNYVNGEYVSFINCNDWIDLNYCNILYNTAKKFDSDMLIFKLLNFEKEIFTEDYYFNFPNFEENLFDKSFTYKDISDIIFEMPHMIYNKFFKTTFLKNLSIKFLENNTFDDLPLFFKIILNAKNIALIDKYIYFKRICNLNETAYSEIIKNIIEATDNVFSIFNENGCFEKFERNLFNYKLENIRYWYSLLNDDFKFLNFDLIKHDFMLGNFKSMKNKKHILNERNLFFYDSVTKSSNFLELEKIYEFKNTKIMNKHLWNKNNQLKQELDFYKELCIKKDNELDEKNNLISMLSENNKKQTIQIDNLKNKVDFFYLDSKYNKKI